MHLTLRYSIRSRTLTMKRAELVEHQRPSVRALPSLADGIVTMDMGQSQISDGKCKSIAALLVDFDDSAVLAVDLSQNMIGCDGAMSLAQALEMNDRVTALNLSHNFIAGSGSERLGNALARSALRRLDLSHNPLGTRGLNAIGTAISLPAANVLRSLKLTDVKLDAVGARALASGLSANRGLRVLSMGNNPLRPSGAVQLARAIVTNTTAKKGAGITALDLSYSGMGDGPVAVLARGLKAGASLRRLDLSHNKIQTAGAAGLAAMMAVHTGLQMLVLDHNPGIAFEGCKSFLALEIDRVLDVVSFKPAPKLGTTAARVTATSFTACVRQVVWQAAHSPTACTAFHACRLLSVSRRSARCTSLRAARRCSRLRSSRAPRSGSGRS